MTKRREDPKETEAPRCISLGGGRSAPYPTPRDAAASAVGRGNPRTGTNPEIALRSALHHAGLRFRKDYPIRGNARRPIRVDIAFPRARLAVFVDGCFWHGCPEHGTTPRTNQAYWAPKLARNAERDRENDVRLRELGWRVVRIWEHVPVTQAVADVLAALGGPPGEPPPPA
jgi:DNA mismatch endonuclease, patch repair protein